MKSVLIIGLGRFGKHLTIQFSKLGHQTMVVDESEELVNEVLPFATSAQIGDSTNAEFLKSLGVHNFDVCFVAMGSDFQSSLETTSLLKELGAKLVVSKAGSKIHAKFLLRNGADEIIYPEKQVAHWAAIRYGSNHILDYIELDESHAIFEVPVPKSWLGKTIGQIDVRKKFDINIMATKQNGKMDMVITPDTVLTEDKTLLVIGEHKSLQKCFHI